MTDTVLCTATCLLCEERIDVGQDASSVGSEFGVRWAHRECLLRSTMGGIGHLTDHKFWCLTMSDPDGGKSYRESALLVDQWVVDNA